MGYIKEFENQIAKRDFNKILQLWEEYCASDTPDSEELVEILNLIEKSEFAKTFGKFAEMGLFLLEHIKNEDEHYKALRKLIDLQTTNSEALAKATSQALEKKYGRDPKYQENLRLVGMRGKADFQGALSNYDLLDHMKKGNCVYHNGGWGTGEIIEVSELREQLSVEFEYVAGKKHITFTNAFKSLIPLPPTHFLTRRFMNPEELEKEAKNDPVGIIKILLRDLGPRTAAEIKDDLCDIVIPEKDWQRFWQTARAKLKKDTLINTPAQLKDSFSLRTKELTHEDRLQNEIQARGSIEDVIQTSYNFVRDFPNMLKKEDVKSSIIDNLKTLLTNPGLKRSQELEIYIFLEQLFGEDLTGFKTVKSFIKELKDPFTILDGINIIAFKKRVLTVIREAREDWQDIFLDLLFTPQQALIRDYMAKELCQAEAREKFKERLESLLANPLESPETFVWYFQKILNKDIENLPFQNKEGEGRFLESFLTLLHRIESRPEYKDLTKKMIVILSGKRYETVRKILEGTSIEFVKEFLLLTSKCHSFGDHDQKTLRSLAQVVHPSLSTHKRKKDRVLLDGRIVWTTEEGYKKTRDRAELIGTVEIVENAREVEAARALGDLRENSEYKFAVERRRHLQSELKRLGDLLNRARIISTQDVENEEVGIGNVVEIENSKNERLSYTILGPWDADADNNIISFQSKLAQAMCGKKPGETFHFREDDFKVLNISSFLEK